MCRSSHQSSQPAAVWGCHSSSESPRLHGRQQERVDQQRWDQRQGEADRQRPAALPELLPLDEQYAQGQAGSEQIEAAVMQQA